MQKRNVSRAKKIYNAFGNIRRGHYQKVLSKP